MNPHHLHTYVPSAHFKHPLAPARVRLFDRSNRALFIGIWIRRTLILLAISWLAADGSGVAAEQISLPAVRDNTLYEYDPVDDSVELNSNGAGNVFSAGRTLSRSQIRRGLVQFDFATIPVGADVVPGSLTLDLYVVDVPRRDPARRPFWFVPLDEVWGEGMSVADAGVSGAGSGAAATSGDATWFHTDFDPAVHDDQTFTPGAVGFWTQQEALGAAPLDPHALYGDPVGIFTSEAGPISLRATSLENDVNAWLHGQTNAGWIVVGDESLEADAESRLPRLCQS